MFRGGIFRACRDYLHRPGNDCCIRISVASGKETFHGCPNFPFCGRLEIDGQSRVKYVFFHLHLCGCEPLRQMSYMPVWWCIFASVDFLYIYCRISDVLPTFVQGSVLLRFLCTYWRMTASCRRLNSGKVSKADFLEGFSQKADLWKASHRRLTCGRLVAEG